MLNIATLRYCKIDNRIDKTVNREGVAIAVVRSITPNGDLLDFISEEMKPTFNRIFRFERKFKQSGFEVLLESTQKDIDECRKDFEWLDNLGYYEVREIDIDGLKEPNTTKDPYRSCLNDIRSCYDIRLAYLVDITFNESMIKVHKRQLIL